MPVLQWERIRSETKTETGASVADGSRIERARVPGGWLVRMSTPGGNGGGASGVVLVFVADCGEEWRES
ncbi:MAG TPA: hypothetical protein DFS52_03765 [Myxococcales bacterium]|jgi:hypothetical protein|nr:hypothetical protein [Myxococcales bacterium]